MTTARSLTRGISPVVGAVLIIAITVATTTILGAAVLKFGDSTTPSDPVTVDTHVAKGNVEVEVTAGSTDKVALLVNGTVEDTQLNATPGDNLYAENVKANAKLTVIGQTDGEREVLSMTRVLPRAAAPAFYKTVGETGTITVSSDDGSDWTHLDFEHTYSNPVVIAKPASYSDASPAHIRIRNVSATGADIKPEEWDYQDGTHGPERVHYVVMEEGTYMLEDGTVVDVGTTSLNSVSFVSRDFNHTFGERPILFTQVQSDNSNDSVVTRQKDISTYDYRVRMQEQASNANDGHVTETVGYLAVEPHRGLYRFKHESSRTGTAVTDSWYTVNFDNVYGEDRLALLTMQTTQESDAATLRYRDLTSTSVSIFVQEESSADTETDHAAEQVGYWVFDRSRDLIARQTNPNSQPDVTLSANRTTVNVSEPIQFNASASDADGTIQSYAWDFDGDGETDATTQNVTHAYNSTGMYEVSVTVTDDDGGKDTDAVWIDVNDGSNAAPNVTLAANRTDVGTGDDIAFSANASDPDGDSLQYEWDFNGDGATDTTGGANVTHEYLDAGNYTASVTVTDNDGATATDSVNISVTLETYVIGEVGTTSLDTDNQSDFTHTINFNNSYTDPVVIIKPPTYNGGQKTAHIRMKSPSSTSVDIQLEEWDYLNEAHTTETVHYMVIEKGTYTLPDGTKLEVGATDIDNQTKWVTPSFNQSFNTTPVVFSQPQTYVGEDSITTRHRNIGTGAFDLMFQEQESYKNSGHWTETIGYVAIEPNVGTNGGRKYEVGTTADTVDENWHTISFSQSYGSSRTFIGDWQTADGGDPVAMRYRNFTSSSIELFVEEEKSDDSGTGHATEQAGYWVFSSGNISAKDMR